MSDLTPIIKASDLSLVEGSAFNQQQLERILKRTPEKYIRTRPAKGGGTWQYVSGGYVKKLLNIMFGFDWDFEVMEQLIIHREAVVKGRLTIRTNGKTIVKTQFGNKDIIYRKGTDEPLSIGNDLKAACTDALKKCASEIGIAADVYNAQEFQAINVVDDSSIDSINEAKEIARIKEYIGNAKSRTELLQVLDKCEEYGLIELYDSRLNEIDNGK